MSVKDALSLRDCLEQEIVDVTLKEHANLLLRNRMTEASTLVNSQALGPRPNMLTINLYVRPFQTNLVNLQTVSCKEMEK
jgi:hypothetical protein